MKDAKTIVPLIITGIDILIYLAPIIILLPLLMLISSLDGGIPAFLAILADMILMCLAPISQLVLAIVAIVNRKWWLLLIHIPFIALTAGVCYVFYDWISHIT